jgi:hypothetical protein
MTGTKIYQPVTGVDNYSRGTVYLLPKGYWFTKSKEAAIQFILDCKPSSLRKLVVASRFAITEGPTF